jgi:hypothetical protein
MREPLPSEERAAGARRASASDAQLPPPGVRPAVGLTGTLTRAYDEPTDPPSGVPGALLKQVPCRARRGGQRPAP